MKVKSSFSGKSLEISHTLKVKMPYLFSLVLIVYASVVLSEDIVIDLTHTVGKQSIHFPQNPPFNFTNVFRLSGPYGLVAEGNAFQTAEHTGTHMDAPRHFCPSGKFVKEIAMLHLSGRGVVIDLKSEAEVDHDFEATAQTLKDWEKIYGEIPENAIILFNFGWEKYYPNRKLVFKTENFMDTTTFHFPGLSPDAARWLTANRKVRAVGSDTPSIDFGQTREYETHAILLCNHEIVILENVANLDKMRPTGTKVYIGALKLEHGSGTPVRLFAVSSCVARLDNIHVCLYIVMVWYIQYLSH